MLTDRWAVRHWHLLASDCNWLAGRARNARARYTGGNLHKHIYGTR